jgi:hypothetical protein
MPERVIRHVHRDASSFQSGLAVYRHSVPGQIGLFAFHRRGCKRPIARARVRRSLALREKGLHGLRV